ncbi:MAG: EpsG family protein [Fusobacterium sp.]
MKKLIYIKKNKILFIMIGLLLIYKISTRTTGIDFSSYVKIYERTQELDLKSFSLRIEPLFLLMFLLSPTQVFAFGIIGTISLYFKLNSILKFSYYPFLSLIYYIMFFFIKDDMGRIRAGVASAIMIYATKYLESRKYLLFIFIAFLFHRSIILYFIVYILYNRNLSQKKLEIFFIFSILLSLIDFSKLIYCLTFIPYIKTTILLYISKIERIYFSPIMIMKCFYVYLFFRYYKKLCLYKYFKQLFLVYLVGNMIYFSFNSINIIATRGSEIFSCIEFILLPYLLKISNKYIIKIVIFIIITAYYMYGCYNELYYLIS